MINSKKIKILTSGPIDIDLSKKTLVVKPLHIWGPVLTPYNESMDVIFKMLASKVKLVEVADDGQEFELTLQNYQNDNSKLARESKETKKENKKQTNKENSVKLVKEVKPETVNVDEHIVISESVKEDNVVVDEITTEEAPVKYPSRPEGQKNKSNRK